MDSSHPDAKDPMPHQQSNSDHLSPLDWRRLEKQMSFSRDSSHLIWHSKNGDSNVAKSGGHQGDQRVWFCIQFRRLCEVCLAMPLFGLVACLVIALIFQFDHIQETACKVYNFVPSISAVTGISPGRYLWRMAIAFHLGPRILIVSSYYHFLLDFASRASRKDACSLTKLLQWCYYLQIVEIIGLCGISFVHNREHYPTHEKGFILYLTSSHLSFMLILRIYHILWPQLNNMQRKSYRQKLFLFVFSFTGLILMGYFYYRHIVHCDNLAFTLFAFIEYWVAAANMVFYWTVGCDMPNEEIVVLRPAVQSRPLEDNKEDSDIIAEDEEGQIMSWQQISYDVMCKFLSSLMTIKHLLLLASNHFSEFFTNKTQQKAKIGSESWNDGSDKKEI